MHFLSFKAYCLLKYNISVKISICLSGIPDIWLNTIRLPGIWLNTIRITDIWFNTIRIPGIWPGQTQNLIPDKNAGFLVQFTYTVYQRSPYPNHIVTYCIKWVKNSWTDSITLCFFLLLELMIWIY